MDRYNVMSEAVTGVVYRVIDTHTGKMSRAYEHKEPAEQIAAAKNEALGV